MIVNRAATKRQTTVLALLILIVIAGTYSYLTLPREAFPDITIPYIFITTDYEGVAPSDIETLISIPLERKLKGLADVEEITSSSLEGKSIVAVKFLPNVDIDDALRKVKDKVDEAKPDLPEEMPKDPEIKEVNFQDFPILRVILSGPFSLRRLKNFADDFKDKIEGIPGVLAAEIYGGLEREIHVEFDLDRVAAYNMPFSSLINAVNKSNINMPGGSVEIGPGKYMVRVPEDYKHPAEIFSIVAFVRDGRPVYLRDVAYIRDSHKDPLTISRINGQPSVTLGVKKRSGENIVRVADAVKEAVAELQPSLPPTLRIDLTSDMSKDVRLMVKDLENNILSGLVLVLAVIVIFIGGRSALFVSLAIPYSMLLTFMILQGLNITLNEVVLFSLILALGMLVDNGIVIVENIFRHMQMGKSRPRAALEAVDEVAWPVITSTLTTLGAFFPMLFWPGIMGEFMKYLPITLIISLSASLFVALVINPVLSARYQTVKPVADDISEEKVLESRLPVVKRIYLRMLDWSLDHRLAVVALAVVTLVGLIAAFGRFGAGTEFFPEADPRVANINVKAPVGTNLETTDRFSRKVEEIVSQYEDVRFVITNTGMSVGGFTLGQGTASYLAGIALDFKDFHERSRPSPRTIDEIRTKVLAAIKGAEVRVEKEHHGPPTGEPINLEISGPKLEVLLEIAERVRRNIQDVPGLTDLKDNIIRGKPEIKIQVDKEKAALLGLDTYTIAYTVKTAVNGAKVGVFREGKDEYDIVARLPEKDRRSLESLKRLTISGAKGEPIPITSVASFELSSGLGAITRKDQKRVVTVSGKNSGRLPNDIIKDVQARLVKMPWPRGYEYKFTGERQEQGKAEAFLSKAFVAALFIILITLMLQFDSLAVPLIILTTVLMSLIGVFLGLLVTNKPFGVIMTGIGVISLAGVVVNNAIVLIDYYHQLMDKGLPSRKALLTAGVVRFRPVMLTAITTLLGLVPMATGVSFDFIDFAWEVGSESSQWWSSMAVAVIFGLGVATLLTLVLVPVLCSLSYSLGSRFRKRKAEPVPAA
ncbi:MAG: efflux RND transporter permease subunit [Thermodesulfobacteriota bacterium]